jgi:hypothetical protein
LKLLKSPLLPLALLLVVALLTLIRFDRPLVRGDGVAYLAWVDTFVRDADIDLNNQFERFQPVNTYQITWGNTMQRWVIVFPFGAAFVLAPFYAVGNLFAQNGWLDANPAYFAQMQGIGLPYSFWLMMGTNVLTLVTLAIAWHIGRRFVSGWIAALAVYAFFVGTPLLFYSAIEPMNSHSPGAFAAACFLFFLLRCTTSLRRAYRPDQADADTPRTLDWIALGICAGVTILVRWQLAAVVIPAWGILLYETLQAPLHETLHERRHWRGILISSAAAAIVLLPLPLIWQQMFGAPFVIPYNEASGGSFLKPDNEVLKVIQQTLLASPLIALIIPGLILLARRAPLWALLFAVIIFGQWIINGAALDWNAGYSFGTRRMTELFVIYALLACVTFGTIETALRERRLLRLILPVLLVAATAYSFLYLLSFLSFVWTSVESWLGDLSPFNVIPYFLNQSNRVEVINAIFTTHLGPPAWMMPGP